MARFKYARRRVRGMVTKCRNFRVRVNVHKAARELVAFANANQPRVVLRLADTQRQQLFEHDCDFLTVRRTQ
ncbi:hypothetical protein D3C80_1574690 [compost metagenome]